MMLGTALLLALTQAPRNGVLVLEEGEKRTLVLKGIGRIAVSTGTADAYPRGNDRVEFIGSQLGTWPFVAWDRDDHRVTFLVKVVPKKPPRAKTTQASGNPVVTSIDDELTEITSVSEVGDGGLHLTARNAKGELVEIDLQPR